MRRRRDACRPGWNGSTWLPPTERRRDARADPAWREQILAWYAQPSSGELAAVGGAAANAYGIQDLHGLVWEWVDDASALLVSADNREQGAADRLQFCGAAALSTDDRENYAILMRVALLSSVQAADATGNLGFRCALDAAMSTRLAAAACLLAWAGIPAAALAGAPAAIPGDSVYQLRRYR